MSVCFAFQHGMRTLRGTRGHFPTEEGVSFKARGPTVTTILIVMKYCCCGEDRREKKMITRNENQVHIGSLGKKPVINDAVPVYQPRKDCVDFLHLHWPEILEVICLTCRSGSNTHL